MVPLISGSAVAVKQIISPFLCSLAGLLPGDPPPKQALLPCSMSTLLEWCDDMEPDPDLSRNIQLLRLQLHTLASGIGCHPPRDLALAMLHMGVGISLILERDLRHQARFDICFKITKHLLQLLNRLPVNNALRLYRPLALEQHWQLLGLLHDNADSAPMRADVAAEMHMCLPELQQAVMISNRDILDRFTALATLATWYDRLGGLENLATDKVRELYRLYRVLLRPVPKYYRSQPEFRQGHVINELGLTVAQFQSLIINRAMADPASCDSQKLEFLEQARLDVEQFVPMMQPATQAALLMMTTCAAYLQKDLRTALVRMDEVEQLLCRRSSSLRPVQQALTVFRIWSGDILAACAKDATFAPTERRRTTMCESVRRRAKLIQRRIRVAHSSQV